MNSDSPSDNLWTDAELEATVGAYLEMLQLELQGTPYSKAGFRKGLLDGPLARRTEASVEYRMRNISAVRDEIGLEWIRGYRPALNVGTATKRRLAAAMGQLVPDGESGPSGISYGGVYRRPDEEVTTSPREPFDGRSLTLLSKLLSVSKDRVPLGALIAWFQNRIRWWALSDSNRGPTD